MIRSICTFIFLSCIIANHSELLRMAHTICTKSKESSIPEEKDGTKIKDRNKIVYIRKNLLI